MLKQLRMIFLILIILVIFIQFRDKISYHHSTSQYQDLISIVKLHRSSNMRCQFMKKTGYNCKIGRPGYIIDHIVPLCYGGKDDISNMQWQTKEDSLIKDIWERQICLEKKGGLK